MVDIDCSNDIIYLFIYLMQSVEGIDIILISSSKGCEQGWFNEALVHPVTSEDNRNTLALCWASELSYIIC